MGVGQELCLQPKRGCLPLSFDPPPPAILSVSKGLVPILVSNRQPWVFISVHKLPVTSIAGRVSATLEVRIVEDKSQPSQGFVKEELASNEQV